ncbi:DUF2189 domain-containing protein [Ectothiorhodospiraceae bacterium WFHF3C12]|nr:DUF2189 domain-containing protein [Ectothiorhodospiraceae bacterium WFHF3C12]
MTEQTPPEEDHVPLPGVRDLSPAAPWRWLRAGWADFRRAPAHSFAYGAILVLASYAITGVMILTGNWVFMFSLLTGFMLIAPVLAFALYETSRRLQLGQPPSIAGSLQAVRSNFGNELIFAVVLLIVLLVWARAAAMVHVFFPALSDPSLYQLVAFFSIGTAVGAVFAAVAFAVSAFSLPMMMDRRADVISAVITSFMAVLRNKGVMVIWAALILISVLVGFATAYLGLVITLPVIGYATWHAYQDTIEAPGATEREGDSG